MSSFLDLLVLAFGFVVLVLGGRNLRRLWRDQLPMFARPQSWWPYGDAVWRAWIRAMPLGWLAACTLVLALVTAPLVPSGDAYPLGFARPLWYTAPVLLVFLGSLLLMLTVALFNTPKWPVPPHLRAQRGALAEWWSRRRRKRPRER
jgi:hypothetical protein